MAQIQRKKLTTRSRDKSSRRRTVATKVTLSNLPEELLSEIVYWLRALSYPREQRCAKALLVASKSLRLTSRSLSATCFATFISDMQSNTKSCEDDRRIRYHMSFASLKVLETIINNKSISPLIHEIEYVSFDLQRSLGTKKYLQRLARDLKIRDRDIRWKKAYSLMMKCIAFYVQHQHLLRIQKDRQVLEKARTAFTNLRRIKFTRYGGNVLPESFSVARGFYKKWLSDVDIHNLRRPLYLEGFCNLSRMAIEAPNIYGVTLNSIVPDLMLSSLSGQNILQDLFKRITTARIYFAADNFEGLPLCRSANFGKETRIWRSLLNNGTWISKLELGISRDCKQFNCTSSLFDSMISLLCLPRLRKLYLENVLIYRDDLRSLVTNHSTTLKRIYLSTVSVLLAETYDAQEVKNYITSWFDLLCRLPQLEKCRDRYGLDCVDTMSPKPIIQEWLQKNVCTYHKQDFVDGLPIAKDRKSIDIGTWVVKRNDLSEEEAALCDCTQRRLTSIC